MFFSIILGINTIIQQFIVIFDSSYFFFYIFFMERYNKNNSIKYIDIETTDLNIFIYIENRIKNNAELIYGLIKTIKKRKIFEIWVSSDGSSVLILNAIKDI